MKKIFLGFVLTSFLLVFFAGCPVSNKTVIRYQKMEEKVDHPTSIEELKEAISKYEARIADIQLAHQQIAIWYKMLGTRYVDAKMYGEAMKCFQKALEIYPDNQNLYYWVGGTVAENTRTAFSATAGKWSLTEGGEAIAGFVPGEGDTAVFTTLGVNLYANNVAANIRALVDVSFYNYDTKNDYEMSGDLYVESGATLSIKALKSHKLTQTGAVTGSGTLRAYAETISSTVDISGDTSAFTGNVNFVIGSNNTLAACRIGKANTYLERRKRDLQFTPQSVNCVKNLK